MFLNLVALKRFTFLINEFCAVFMNSISVHVHRLTFLHTLIKRKDNKEATFRLDPLLTNTLGKFDKFSSRFLLQSLWQNKFVSFHGSLCHYSTTFYFLPRYTSVTLAQFHCIRMNECSFHSIWIKQGADTLDDLLEHSRGLPSWLLFPGVHISYMWTWSTCFNCPFFCASPEHSGNVQSSHHFLHTVHVLPLPPSSSQLKTIEPFFFFILKVFHVTCLPWGSVERELF